MWQSLTSSSVTGCRHTVRHPASAAAPRPAPQAAVHACLLWQHGSRCRYAPAHTPLSCDAASQSGVTSIENEQQQWQQLAVHQATQPSSSSPSSTQAQAQLTAGPQTQPHTAPIPQQVTRHNFPSTLPLVQAALQGCTFFALDCEFSGLSTRDPPLDQLLDDAGDRYSRLATEIKDFVVLQFGLSTFHWRPETNSYEACTFNFWLFPQAADGEPDMRFRCQASSLSFLVAQGFDFNRCICDGIPFGRNAAQGQPRTLKKPLSARKAASTTGATGSSGADSQLAGGGASSVERGDSSTVRAADSSASSTSDHSTSRAENGSVSSSGRSGTNSRNHNSTASGGSSSRGSGNSGSKATGMGGGEGAAQLMRLLRDCGRPAVVHNGLQDLLFVMQQFVGPLPDTWDEFKALAAVWFPVGMYDTKAIAADLRRTHPAQVRSFGFLRLEDLLLALQPGGEIETAVFLKAAATAVTPSGAASRPIAGEEAEVEAAGLQAKERAAQACAGAESTGGLETLALGSWLPDVDHAPGFDLYRELVLEARSASSIAGAQAKSEMSGKGDGSLPTSKGEQTEADGEGDSEAAELALAEGPGAGGAGVAGSYEGLSVRAADGGAKVHEAGYDAYITGQVFARLLAVSQRLLQAGTAEPPVLGAESPAPGSGSPPPGADPSASGAGSPSPGAESPAPGSGSPSPSEASTGQGLGPGEQGAIASTSERLESDLSMQNQQGQQGLAQVQGTAQAPETPSPTAQQATRAMGHSVQPCAGTPGLDLAERHWRGRLHVMSCDLPYMALSGPDPKADRSTVLYVSGLPSFMKVSQLRNQLREAGLGRTLVLFQQRIIPGQPRSALVRVPAQHAASAAEAIKALGPKWTVVGYEEYKERQQSKGQGQRTQQWPGTQPGQGRGKAKP